MTNAAEILDELLAQRRIPSATYRLQLNRDFTFRDAQELVPYLNGLGITDCYFSPILKARPGSMHGYDVCDHSQLNPELGGEPAFDAFVAALRALGMGLILDTVPNHMGINDAANAWWMDVLENGPSAVAAPYFDIDWHPVNPDLDNKVLLPVLEDQYGSVLESGKIRLSYEDGAFYLHYNDLKLPVSPRSYELILAHRIDHLAQKLGEEHEHVLELQSILTALSYLPPRKELPQRKIVERNREKEIIKRRLAVLVAASPDVASMLEETLQALNGSPGDPQSFEQLDRLLDQQAFRLANWRVATEEINYRRFFDVNELAAVRVEHPRVFRDTHRLYFEFLAQGKATGLRIDHPDGLWNPANYFLQLQQNYLLCCVRARLGDEVVPGLEGEVAARVASLAKRRPAEWPPWPLYVVVEKILGEKEFLPEDWAVAGTTGYDFLNATNGLFVDGRHEEAFDRLYAEFIGRRIDFFELVVSSQKMIMLVSMASEVHALAHQLDRISERNRRYRDFTLNSLTFVIREIIAALLIYRTYITGPETVTERDSKFIVDAVELAKDRNPRTAEAIFDFVRDTLLLRNVASFRPEDRAHLVEWTMEFQQLTGPVLAKGLEDTAFYVYNRLTSANEVGGHPERFGQSVAEFHRQNQERLQRWPHAMLASSTHDTKRSEDVRARLDVLSEMPELWQAALTRWTKLNASKKAIVEGRPAPDRNDEYLLYQTLLGVWPPGPVVLTDVASVRDRAVAYLLKATKEAKVHTSWVNPQREYDAAVQNFVAGLLPDDLTDPFLAELLELQGQLAHFGYLNSLAQTLLKMTCPGVPDFYQGAELWDFTLVDPDNRRPVDYADRRKRLAELKSCLADAGDDLTPITSELLRTTHDGRVKLYLILQALRTRRKRPEVYASGTYEPLTVTGSRQEHLCAFLRRSGDHAVLVAIPRLVYELLNGDARLPLGKAVWEDTYVQLPNSEAGNTYRNVLTGNMLTVGHAGEAAKVAVGQLLQDFPVALLER